jgi:DNA-binding response OmpR family regulator
MKAKLLLVEDERGILNSLSEYLSGEGFDVSLAPTATEAEEALKSAPPSLIILDWVLPDRSGIELLKDWRRRDISLPVILLTAKADLIDRVLGLELGANDYVTKPFEPRELLARIHVQLRHTGAGTTARPRLHSSGIEMDTRAREVRFRGARVELKRLEFDLLQTFLEAPHCVFSRSELLNNVWGYDSYPTTRTVDNHVSQLRRKLRPELFELVHRVGYRFVPREEGP